MSTSTKSEDNQSDDLEIVDILDDNLNCIDSKPKTVAHEQGLLHATVISELIDSEGDWTLVMQAGDRQDAGQYVSPVGGHVSAGESYEEALKREVEEEVGLTGEVRSVVQAALRVNESSKLGYKRCILAKNNLKKHNFSKDIRLIGIDTIKEVLNIIWKEG